MRRILLLATALCALAIPAATAAADDGPDAVIQYNRTLLRILRTPGQQPATVHATRSMAIVHLAIADGVLRAELRRRGPFQARRTAGAAAAAVAGHDALAALFPAQQAALDAQEQQLLASLPPGRALDTGMREGAAAAGAELALRHGDAWGVTPPPYVPTGAPGDFLPTAPDFAAPVFTHWAAVRPFGLPPAAQFPPPAPPPPPPPAPRRPVPPAGSARAQLAPVRGGAGRGRVAGPGLEHRAHARADDDRPLLERDDPELLERDRPAGGPGRAPVARAGRRRLRRARWHDRRRRHRLLRRQVRLPAV